MHSLSFLLLQGAILAYAFLGGVFLAFSDFIMRALSQTEGTGGVAAMRAINRAVFRWVFMALFLGMAAGSLLLILYAWMGLNGPAGLMILAAGLTYLVGCFAVTVVCNVPMNEALARMDLSAKDTAEYWSRTYLPRWTFWNTVRTLACAVAAALMLLGVLWLAQTEAAAH